MRKAVEILISLGEFEGGEIYKNKQSINNRTVKEVV